MFFPKFIILLATLTLSFGQIWAQDQPKVWINGQEIAEFDVAPKPIDSTCVTPKFPVGYKQPKGSDPTLNPPKVMIQVTIGADGNVTSISQIRDYPPRQGFFQETAKAVRQWKFVPASNHGQPVGSALVITFEFLPDRKTVKWK